MQVDGIVTMMDGTSQKTVEDAAGAEAAPVAATEHTAATETQPSFLDLTTQVEKPPRADITIAQAPTSHYLQSLQC